jgi:hypothetical protein
MVKFPSDTPLAERLERRSRRNPATGCLEWTGGVNGNGYGSLGVGGRKTKLAHRLAFELVHGPMSRNQFVCHRCDNPRCIEVAHLFLGSQLDNMRDMVAKGRHRAVRLCGEQNPGLKVGSVSAECLRVVHALGIFTQEQLGRWWSISQTRVSQLVRTKNPEVA